MEALIIQQRAGAIAGTPVALSRSGLDGQAGLPMFLRLFLVPLFVAGAHLLDWHWLRVGTTLAILKISDALSLPMHLVGPDLLELRGIQMRFAVSCTLIDAFLGAVPLLWSVSAAWWRNLRHLAVLWAVICCANIVRLEAGFVAVNAGAPWWLAHECVSGVTYFCLFLYIVRCRAWEERSTV